MPGGSGVAFQIVDDILNFTDARLLKKKRGEDLAAGKVTYVIFRALQMLSGPDRRRLTAILCSEKLRRDEKTVREGIELIRSSGSLSVCAREATRMVEREWRRFSGFVPPSQSKTMLRILCAGLMNLSVPPRQRFFFRKKLEIPRFLTLICRREMRNDESYDGSD